MSVQLLSDPLPVALPSDWSAGEASALIRSWFSLDDQANVSATSLSIVRHPVARFRFKKKSAVAVAAVSCADRCQFNVELGSTGTPGWVVLCPPKVPARFLPEVTVYTADVGVPSVLSTGHYLGPGSGGFHAFVCGNNAYMKEAPLHSCVGDARAMTELLVTHGYSAVLVEDGDLVTTQSAFELFLQGLQPGHTAVVYFSGHGVQFEGINYLLPIDGVATDPSKACACCAPSRAGIEMDCDTCV